MDPIQFLLFAVVSILTILLVSVGIQAFLIIRQLNKTAKKLNALIDDLHIISSSIARPVSGIAGFIDNLKSIRNFIDVVIDKRHTPSIPRHEHLTRTETIQTFEEEQPEESSTTIHAIAQRGHRFFHRDGKPLTS